MNNGAPLFIVIIVILIVSAFLVSSCNKYVEDRLEQITNTENILFIEGTIILSQEYAGRSSTLLEKSCGERLWIRGIWGYEGEHICIEIREYSVTPSRVWVVTE